MNSALILAAVGLIGQSPLQTGNNPYGPVVARNKTGTTDFVWVSYSTWNTILYKRNETPCCTTTSPTSLGTGSGPECDVDDDTSITGQYNSAVVWYNGSSEIYLSVNAGTAIRVGQKADNTYETGSFPRVGISRTGGRIVVTWNTGSAIRAQLYQIGSGSSVSRLSYPFYITDPSIPTASTLNFAVSCADDGDFVACYERFPASGGPPPYYGTPPDNKGVIIKGWVMPTTFTGTPTALNFNEVKVVGEGNYTGADCAVFYDGSCVVAWNTTGKPAARRYSASGALISNTDVAITGGCNYWHPCGSTPGVLYDQDVYDVSVAAQRCSPGNYVVGYHGKRSSDSYETFRLKICADAVRTHCNEDVLVIGAADGYPEPDVYKWIRVAMDDCGRMVGTFPGKEWSGSLSIFSYFESLCTTCETTCQSELSPCLEIPDPDCEHGLVKRVRKSTAKKATELALAPVPVEPVGTKSKAVAERPQEQKRKAAKLEPKPVAASTTKRKPATN